MKPSKRIEELFKINVKTQPEDADVVIKNIASNINALIAYLDEQYEKEACSRGEHDDEVWNDMYKCKKCEVIHI